MIFKFRNNLSNDFFWEKILKSICFELSYISIFLKIYFESIRRFYLSDHLYDRKKDVNRKTIQKIFSYSLIMKMSIISCQFLKNIIYLNHFIFSILKVTVIWNFIIVRYDLVWWGRIPKSIFLSTRTLEKLRLSLRMAETVCEFGAELDGESRPRSRVYKIRKIGDKGFRIWENSRPGCAARLEPVLLRSGAT